MNDVTRLYRPRQKRLRAKGMRLFGRERDGDQGHVPEHRVVQELQTGSRGAGLIAAIEDYDVGLKRSRFAGEEGAESARVNEVVAAPELELDLPSQAQVIG
jgi:hypothetical protein